VLAAGRTFDVIMTHPKRKRMDPHREKFTGARFVVQTIGLALTAIRLVVELTHCNR
jgi:hypothetical protein